MAVTTAELADALGSAAIAAAGKVQEIVDRDGHGNTAEVWASTAAQLAFAARGIAVDLPARPGKG